MASIKRDDVKQKWEETEFPLVCETCLGDNPYVRMTREEHGKKCQVCERPFTVFAWQAGTKGRLKRVEICRSCARAKNVCQVCIYDLQYGLPVKVRDKVLREAAASSSSAAVMAVPQSQANRSWYTAQQERSLATGQLHGVGAADSGDALAHAQLRDMARMEPRYERNLPKLCSFYAAGECNRGSACPFRHEMPRDRNDPLSKQNTRDRFFGSSDPVANKILGRKRKQEEMERAQSEQQAGDDGGYNKARATLYLRFQGDRDDNPSQQQQPIFPQMTEGDVRDVFYSFGEIASVRVQADRGQAFVEYTQPEACELAIASMNKKELLGRRMYVAWARAPKHGEQRGEDQQRQQQRQQQSSSSSNPDGPAAVVRPVAPPGFSSSSSSKKPPLPKSMLPTVKPPPEVAAIAAARRAQAASGTGGGGGGSAGDGLPRPSFGGRSSVPRPGNHRPYYPSADPTRLGSKAPPSST